MNIAGIQKIHARRFEDQRGSFLKTFSQPDLDALGVDFLVREHYVSVSKRGVLRGMHFQLPPSDHAKLVICSAGRVLDVVLDCRLGSPSHGETMAMELEGASAAGLFIPSGCAHGFLALQDESVMHYLVSSPHDPARDSGILWNSFGFDWPVTHPLLSPRDTKLPRWDLFHSPFRCD